MQSTAKRFFLMTAIAAAITAASAPSVVMAEGSSGPAVHYTAQGQIGEVVVNPYKIAPLTAVIKNGGYDITDATVRVVPKTGGQEIKYHVDDTELRTHAGIPVWGLYADYTNTVEVTYTRIFQGKRENGEVVFVHNPDTETLTLNAVEVTTPTGGVSSRI